MPYLLDTDTFIRAKNDHYGFEICPGFWQWLTLANARGVVYSNEAVLVELQQFGKREEKPPDELAKWAKAQGPGLFLPADSATVQAYGVVSAWAQSSKFLQSGVNEFLAKADSWLVADGQARGLTVVTHERSAPGSKRKIKIPDACAAQSPAVDCVSPFEMLRREQPMFVLERP